MNSHNSDFSFIYFILFSYYDGSQCDLVLKSKDFETKQINLLFFSLIFLICKMELITESLQVCFKMSVEQLTGQVPSSHHYHHYLHLLCLRGVVSGDDIEHWVQQQNSLYTSLNTTMPEPYIFPVIYKMLKPRIAVCLNQSLET